MAYFTELLGHIARFLKDLADRFLELFGFIDDTTDDLVDAEATRQAAEGTTAG